MTARSRRRVLFAAGVVLILSAVGYTLWVRLGPPVVTDALVGQTESQIVRQYGAPTAERPGYHELGLQSPVNLPPGPIRTLVFYLGGLWHLEGGTLYVWRHQQGDDWVCFESCWFARGVKF